jgi:hypothetical protein
MALKFEIATPLFREKNIAENNRMKFLSLGWMCSQIKQLDNGAFTFEAKREKK